LELVGFRRLEARIAPRGTKPGGSNDPNQVSVLVRGDDVIGRNRTGEIEVPRRCLTFMQRETYCSGLNREHVPIGARKLFARDVLCLMESTGRCGGTNRQNQNARERPQHGRYSPDRSTA
jgi:hypothetical protein